MHVAIIMNGNGEWSGRRGLPPTGSRAAGAAALRDAVTVAFDAGIRTLTLYTLCIPSSGRHSHETSADLAVLEEYLGNHVYCSPAQSVGITVVGGREWLDGILAVASTFSPRSQTRGARMQPGLPRACGETSLTELATPRFRGHLHTRRKRNVH